MFGVVWDYYGSKLKGEQSKQNNSPKSYKTEIKILANPAWVSLIGLWTTRSCLIVVFCKALLCVVTYRSNVTRLYKASAGLQPQENVFSFAFPSRFKAKRQVKSYARPNKFHPLFENITPWFQPVAKPLDPARYPFHEVSPLVTNLPCYLPSW